MQPWVIDKYVCCATAVHMPPNACLQGSQAMVRLEAMQVTQQVRPSSSVASARGQVLLYWYLSESLVTDTCLQESSTLGWGDGLGGWGRGELTHPFPFLSCSSLSSQAWQV